MGWEIYWLRRFIFRLPFINLVAPSRVTVYNKNNNLRGVVCNDNARTNILERINKNGQNARRFNYRCHLSV